MTAREPALRLDVQGVARAGLAWRVGWRVSNESRDQVRLLSVQAPHGRFRSEPFVLDTVLVDSAVIEQTVRIDADAGNEIENAFVIFVLALGDERWRVLFRVRVRLGGDGTPAPAVEAMTAHRVGFSEA